VLLCLLHCCTLASFLVTARPVTEVLWCRCHGPGGLQVKHNCLSTPLLLVLHHCTLARYCYLLLVLKQKLWCCCHGPGLQVKSNCLSTPLLLVLHALTFLYWLAYIIVDVAIGAATVG
jgi:hypothetical protein